jgi:hypothetical protein
MLGRKATIEAANDIVNGIHTHFREVPGRGGESRGCPGIELLQVHGRRPTLPVSAVQPSALANWRKENPL